MTTPEPASMTHAVEPLVLLTGGSPCALTGTIRRRVDDFLLEERVNGGAAFSAHPARQWPQGRLHRLQVQPADVGLAHMLTDAMVEITGTLNGTDAQRWSVMVDSITLLDVPRT